MPGLILPRRRLLALAAPPLFLPHRLRAQVGQVAVVNQVVSGAGPSTWTLKASTITFATSSGSVCVTSAINCTGANLLVMVASYASAITPGDSSLNSWLACTAQTNSQSSQIFYVESPTVTSTQTFHITGASFYGAIAVYAYSGAAASSVLDVQNGTNNGTFQPGSITPNFDNSLLVTGIVDSASTNDTINDGFTNVLNSQFQGGTAYGCSAATLVQATKAAINPTWTSNNGQKCCTIAAFKAAVP